MKKRTALGLAVSVATSYPVTLNALGLGELQSSSQLNQPLNAQIELLSTGEKEVGQLRVKLASADVFNRVGIDRPAYLNSLKFRTTTQNGKPVILVSSDQPVKEPFLNFLLEVSWPQGQLLKEYTVLLDPPVLIQAGDAAPQNTASVRAEPKASGVVNRPDASPNQQQTQQQSTNVSNQQQAQTKQQGVLEAQAKIAAQEEQQRQQRSNRPAVARSTATSGSKKYRVRSGDTMQKVTSRLRYAGTTNSQMMMALFKANPHAFAKNNINYLKKGEVLTRPPRSAVSETSKSAARAQIKQQHAAWKQYRKGLATKTVAQQPKIDASNKAGEVDKSVTAPAAKDTANANTKANNSNKEANNNAKLSVVGSEKVEANAAEVTGAGNAEMQKKLALAEEALASTSSKNTELESRVNQLEAIVRKKDRLITLKNERLARLESQLANTGNPANSSTTETGPAVATAQVNEAEDLATNVGNEAGQNGNIILRGDEATATLPAPKVANADASKTSNANDITKASPPPTIDHEKVAESTTDTQATTSPVADNKEAENGSLLDLLKSPLVATIGGGSLLALILGGLFLRRRQNAVVENPDDEFVEEIDVGLENESFGTAGFESKRDQDRDGQTSDNFADLPSKNKGEEDEIDTLLSANSSLDEDEVLQEADVYIVYGLHEQAEDELKKAIAEHPSKLEYRYKLLENYQVADDSEAFIASAKDFLKAEGDNKQELWEKIVELGKKVAPENDMFAEKSATKAATVFAGVVAAAGVATVAGLATSDVMASEDEDTINEAISTDQGFASEAGAISSDATDIESDINQDDEFESLLNADIDLGFDDIDLGLDLPDVGDDNSDQLGSLDLDDNVSLTELTDNKTKKDDLDLSEFSDLGTDDEFDFEGLDSLEGLGGLDDFEPDNSNVLNFKDAETAPASNTTASDSASLNLEIDNNTGLDKVLPTGSYTSALSDDDDDDDALSFLNLPDDDQEMQDAHIGTKLDLARAYLDMGDVEGARCTLEEVVVEGNEAQKREAEEMLQQTG